MTQFLGDPLCNTIRGHLNFIWEGDEENMAIDCCKSTLLQYRPLLI